MHYGLPRSATQFQLQQLVLFLALVLEPLAIEPPQLLHGAPSDGVDRVGPR